jgi:hypothetical protein
VERLRCRHGRGWIVSKLNGDVQRFSWDKSFNSIQIIYQMAIEIVDFPIQNGGSFHSYVKLPEGNQ